MAWVVNGVTIQGVKRLSLVEPPGASLIVFESEESLIKAAAALSPDELRDPPQEMLAVRFCETSKSLCPAVNFVAQSSRGLLACALHKTKRQRTSSAIAVDGASQSASSDGSELSSCLTVDRLTQHLREGVRTGPSAGFVDDGTHLDLIDAFFTQEENSKQQGSLLVDNHDMVADSHVQDSVDDLGHLFVSGTLHAAGDTLKSTGSSMWTVVSDERLKNVRSHAPCASCLRAAT